MENKPMREKDLAFKEAWSDPKIFEGLEMKPKASPAEVSLAEFEAIKADRDRLLETLKEIANEHPGPYVSDESYEGLQDLAREALASQSQKGDSNG